MQEKPTLISFSGLVNTKLNFALNFFSTMSQNIRYIFNMIRYQYILLKL